MNKIYPFITLLAICWSTLALAFDSGSTGTDGALNITRNTQLQLPPSGIFNYTDITVARRARLSFIRNANNTSVTLLASGDVTIDGTIDVSGQQGGPYNGDPVGGAGGPGGFDGGASGLRPAAGLSRGQDGQGPGAGSGGVINSHGGPGVFGNGISDNNNIYGNPELLPLIGGSGGGGGGGRNFRGSSFKGSGGGGGGGAILIAASGTVTVNGSILANGGAPGVHRFQQGGPGSGGAIRIVATTLTGEGIIRATGGGNNSNHGRIRLEAETFNRTTNTNPGYAFDKPGRIRIPNLPTLRITSIGGMTVPANLTGFRDIILPGITTNPVTVNFATTHVPAGTTIVVKAVSAILTNNTVIVSSQPTAMDGSATADITLPYGDSSLSAQLTLELTASLGRDYSRYAQGEPVQRIRLNIDDKGQSTTTTLITESGKEYTIPTMPLAMQ